MKFIDLQGLENEALHDYKAIYRDAFKLASEGKSITLPTGKIAANRAFAEMLGYKLEELSEVSWQDLTPPDEIEYSQKQVVALIASERDNTQFLKRYKHKSGSYVQADVRVTIKRNPDRSPLYFITTILDITEQKKLETEKLKKSAELELILNNMLNAFVICESVFDDKGKYISFRFGLFNDAYAKSSGLKQEEVLGKDVFEVWPDNEQTWVELYGEVAVTGIPISFDMYHSHTKSWYHCNAYRPSASPNRICVISEDITARKEQEEVVDSINRGILVLHKTALNLTATPESKEVYMDIAVKLKDLTHGSSATFGIYDPKDKCIHVKHNEIDKHLVSQLLQVLGGKQIYEVGFPVDDKLYQTMCETPISYVSSLNEATFGVIPKFASNIIQKAQGFDRYLGIAYILDGKLYGSSLVALRRDVPNPPDELIQSFAQIVAVTLSRYRIEETLRAKEKELRLITDNITDSVWLTDMSFKTTWISPSIIKLRGFTLEEMSQFSMDKHLTPQSIRTLNEIIVKVMAPERLADPSAEITANLELEYFRKDGSTYWVDSVATVIRDDEGRPSAILGVGRDITEAKSAKLALLRQATRLQNLHEIDRAILFAKDSPELISTLALNRLRDILLSQWAIIGVINKSKDGIEIYASENTGQSAIQHGLNFPLDAFGKLDNLKHRDTEIFRELNSGELLPSCLELLRSEGGIAGIIVPLFSSDTLIGLIALAWNSVQTFEDEKLDVAHEVAGQISLAIEQARLRKETELYATEMEERIKARTAELEVANRDLEAFSYSVSHDLRAPLRVIDGYINILLEDHAKLLNEEGKKVCAVISNGAQNMSRLIDDILAFSHIGRSAIQRSSVNMHELASSVARELITPENEARTEINIYNLPDVSGDSSMLRQVWVNLIGNAVKFTAKKDLARIDISGELLGDEAIYSVADNGAGFNMELYDKLFAAFQRLHTSKEYDGTGVGLAIVKRVIERHNGRIWAIGETGKGSKFSFSIKQGDE